MRGVSRLRYLSPALAAVLTVALLLLGVDLDARRQIKRRAFALAALNLPENTRGSALQIRLFALPRCLPVYGSSELDIAQPTRPDLLFHGGRQGFHAVVIGQPGDRCLVMLQELAALGDAVRGRKVVVFLSPVWFLSPPSAGRDSHAAHRQMAANFSPLQTGRTLLSDTLKPATKAALAARLLDYDNVVRARSPLLHFALVGLRSPSRLGRSRFFLVRPLLTLQNQTLAFQDRFHQLELLAARPQLRPVGRPYESRRKSLDWAQLLADVTRAESKGTRSSAGDAAPTFLKSSELRRFRDPGHLQNADETFLHRLADSPEWNDLDLLLRSLREMGARPLLIDQPFNGRSSDRDGVSPQARRQYYDRIAQAAARRRVPLRDFSADEEDPAFFLDTVHPSAKAWVHYDQALAEFYRGNHG